MLLVVSLSVADTSEGISHMISSVTTSFSDDEKVQFPNGTYGRVIEGDVDFSTPITLRSGALRIASHSEQSVHIGSIQASIFDGGMYVLASDDTVTIAALTSPVFISSGDQRMIVPIGMQWTGSTKGISPITAGFSDWMNARKLSPLPTHFQEEHIRELRIEEKNVVSLLPDLRSNFPVETISFDTLLLPVSRADDQKQREEHILGFIRSLVERDDVVSFQEVIQDEEVQAVLSSHRGREVVATIIGQLDMSTSMQMELLMRVADKESMWELVSFHPEFRDVAWTLVGPTVSVESQLVHVFLFPFSLFSPENVSDFVMDRYSVTLEGIVSNLDDESPFVDHLLDTLLPLVDRLEEKGYPRRAMHMSAVLVSLINSIDHKTDAMKDAVVYLQFVSQADIRSLPVKTVKKQDTAPVSSLNAEEKLLAPEVVYPPQEVEAIAYDMLQKSGALFTVDTGIAAYTENKARVSGIFFSSPKEDRSVTFTLDVHTKIVSEIEINGKSDFPYEPSFDGFVEWISH